MGSLWTVSFNGDYGAASVEEWNAKIWHDWNKLIRVKFLPWRDNEDQFVGALRHSRWRRANGLKRVPSRERKQPWWQHQQDRHQFACYKRWKTVLHGLHALFSCLYGSLSFSFSPRREMTCISVAWTTWAIGEKFLSFSSIFELLFNSRIVCTHFFFSQTAWIKWGIISRTRSHIFRCRSCCRRRRPRISSLLINFVSKW